MGDFTYRTREQVEEWKRRCPIAMFRNRMLSEFGVTESQLQEIESQVSALVAEARQCAERSPFPEPSTATLNVYAQRRTVPVANSHSLPAMQVPTVEPDHNRVISFTHATREALSEEMALNPKLFVMGEGIGIRGGNFKTTEGLYDIYGSERLCDTPIAERGFVGLAGGAAMTGTRPVIDFMFADFILDAFGEIVNQIAKMQYMSSGRLRMPILMRGCIGIGHSAATHHSGSYYAMYAQVPGLRVVVPSNPYDAKGLMKHALRCDDPVMFLEHREILAMKCYVPAEDYEIEFGRATVVRAGRDVTVVALARMVHLTLSTCEELERHGISVELVDPRTVSPLDVDTILQSVAKTGRLLIVDELPSPCGFSAEIAAQVSDSGFNDLDAPIRRLTGVFTPTPYSPTLEAAVVPTADAIVNAIRSLVKE
jgi:2-oxoisovalerate dehydrogenase E1 component